MRLNGNFSDSSFERLHSVSINSMMTLNDAVDVEVSYPELMSSVLHSSYLNQCSSTFFVMVHP